MAADHHYCQNQSKTTTTLWWCLGVEAVQQSQWLMTKATDRRPRDHHVVTPVLALARQQLPRTSSCGCCGCCGWRGLPRSAIDLWKQVKPLEVKRNSPRLLHAQTALSPGQASQQNVAALRHLTAVRSSSDRQKLSSQLWRTLRWFDGTHNRNIQSASISILGDSSVYTDQYTRQQPRS